MVLATGLAFLAWPASPREIDRRLLGKWWAENPPWIIEEPTLRTYEFREDGSLEIGIADRSQLTWRVDWWVEKGELVLHTRPTSVVETLQERLNRLSATVKGRRSWPGHSSLSIEVIGPDRIRLQAEQGRPLDLTPFRN